MRAVGFAIALMLVAGCGGTRTCKPKTALVTIELDDTSENADSLSLVISVGTETGTRTIAHSVGVDRGTVEIDFSDGYPAGQTINIEVDATAAGAIIGTGATTATLGATCSAIEVDVTGTQNVSGDLSGAANDLSGTLVDLAGQQISTDFAACTDVFVSPSGDDANSGCDPSVPLKTISAALNVATATDIRVCKGTYPEHFQVTTALALHGGYDCTSWTRTSGYGYPTFDGVNESIIAPGTTGTVLSVNSTGVTVEGFTVDGADGPAGSTDAMVIAAAGAAVVHDNHIVGGGNSTASSGFGSVGLNVISTTMSDIYANLINGGSGSSTSLTAAGSVGVTLSSPGLCHLHGNTIQGGTGQDNNSNVTSTMMTGAVGVLFQANGTAFTQAAGNAVEGNLITGGGPGTASTLNHLGAGAIGVRVGNTQTGAVDLVGNTIDAGSGVGGSACNTIGVALLSTGAVTVANNRINGGSVMTTPTGSGVGTIGVYAGAGTLTIVDNMIHGGNSGSNNINADGIEVITNDVKIEHNTIFGGVSAHQGVGIHVVGTAADTTITSNLYLGIGPSVGIFLDNCSDQGPIAVWNGNATAFADVLDYGLGVTGTCADGSHFSTAATTTAELVKCTSTTSGPCSTFGGTTAANGIYALASCGADSACATVPGCTNAMTAGSDPTTCAQGIFTSYNTASNGVADLEAAGWKLKTNTPCKISKNGFDDSATVPKDLYGTTRTTPPSIGAHEFDGTCM